MTVPTIGIQTLEKCVPHELSCLMNQHRGQGISGRIITCDKNRIHDQTLATMPNSVQKSKIRNERARPEY